jgi:hypothetical protein
MIEPGFLIMETCLKVENGSAMLNGNDATCRKTFSVTNAIDLIHDWEFRITWPKEVRVERMDKPAGLLNCSSSGHKSLTCNLATKYALAVFIWGETTKQVDFNWLEVEKSDEFV